MEAAVERENMRAAWKQVKRNKRAARADGMTVEDLEAALWDLWPQVGSWPRVTCSIHCTVFTIRHEPPDREPYVRWYERRGKLSSPFYSIRTRNGCSLQAV